MPGAEELLKKRVAVGFPVVEARCYKMGPACCCHYFGGVGGDDGVCVVGGGVHTVFVAPVNTPSNPCRDCL